MLQDANVSLYNQLLLSLITPYTSQFPDRRSLIPLSFQQLFEQQSKLFERYMGNQDKLSMIIEERKQQMREEQAMESQGNELAVKKQEDNFPSSFNISSQKIEFQNMNESLSESGGRRLRRRKKIAYQFDSQELDSEKKRKLPETKNIVKSYSTAIFQFLKRKQSIKNKFLQELQITEEDFENMIGDVKGKIHSISDLRNLWSQHKYSKIFRMLCEEYTRKHYFEHIFNGRVIKIQNHLKYRSKILKSIRNPEKFTFLKEE